MRYDPKKTNRGLSLIELLIAVAIVALLIIAVLVAMRLQLSRSRDARRKGDLDKIKIAFEDYYNDNGCYPAASVLEECDSSSFAPYLAKIPCDPQNKQAYVYLPLSGNACKGYRILAALEDPKDPAIAKIGCDTACGCGYGSAYNYGVSAGVSVASDTCEPLASPVPSPIPSPSPVVPTPSVAPVTPSPTPSGQPTPSPIYEYACDPSSQHVCNAYDIGTVPSYCPRSYPTAMDCQNAVDQGTAVCCTQ
jgi:prepilin-type N-terminal cleavage/methylation domain-containing protein